MSQCIKTQFVGLDVHKDTIVIAVAELGPGGGTGDRDGAIRMEGLEEGTRQARALVPRFACCYEAGPTGYGLARALIAADWSCDVIAPSLIPKKSGERIKTDRRDAMKLAQNLRAGELVAVFIPDEKTEAIRDLERAREDAKKAERVARHQLSKFLLRNGRRYPGKTTWNDAHRAWIAKQAFAEPAQQYVLTDGLAAVEAATLRCQQLTERLREVTKGW